MRNLSPSEKKILGREQDRGRNIELLLGRIRLGKQEQDNGRTPGGIFVHSRRNEEAPVIRFHPDNEHFRPCMIVAHQDAVFAAQISRSFRLQGWDVYLAHTGPAVRRLARMLAAELVIIDADLSEESGWLTCVKLRSEQSHIKVILIASAATHRAHRFADFIGASALVHRNDGVPALLQEAELNALPVAG
jgi:CheY-like chemotaxis protein